MENNSIDSHQGDTSTLDVSHHSARPPLTTQEILLTSSYLQSINTTPIVSPLHTVINRYTYTAPLVSPVARFNAIDQSSTQVMRSFDSMRSDNRFVFMPTPSLPSSPINVRSTNITNLTRNQGPSSTLFPSCNNFCIHCEIYHNCPFRRWASYLDHISPYPPFTPRIQPPYMHHYQPLNTPINPNQNYCSFANHANIALDVPPRAYLNGAVRTKQVPTQMYKCSICRIEFPTAQAYGGHMSSHSKARKAQFGIDENWVRPKRARPVHQSPIGPDDQQQSSFSTRVNNDNNYLEEFDVPQEVKKEDTIDKEEEEEEEEDLKYLLDDVEPSKSDIE